MWTYLAIFLSTVVLLTVFGRRVYLEIKGKPVDNAPNEPLEEEATKKEKKEEVSKVEKSKLEKLVEKAEGLLKVGREDEAIKHFVQALSIDPAHVDTQHKLGMLYMRKQLFSAAAALFKDLAELTKDPVHYSHLGFAFYQQKALDEARNAYQKAIEYDPSRPQRFVSLCQVYRSLGKPQLALITINRALDLDKENRDYLFLLSDIQKDLELYAESLKVLDLILEQDAENMEAKILRDDVEKLLKEKGE